MVRPKHMQIALRIPAEWLEEADALVARLAVPGLEQTRSDILRRAIAEGLKILQEEAGRDERERKQKK